MQIIWQISSTNLLTYLHHMQMSNVCKYIFLLVYISKILSIVNEMLTPALAQLLYIHFKVVGEI